MHHLFLETNLIENLNQQIGKVAKIKVAFDRVNLYLQNLRTI